MNYGEIERQTFRTFLAFSGILITVVLIFFNISSNFYRVSNITYINDTGLSKTSIERIKGTSIWLVDDTNFDSFYEKFNLMKESKDIQSLKKKNLISAKKFTIFNHYKSLNGLLLINE